MKDLVDKLVAGELSVDDVLEHRGVAHFGSTFGAKKGRSRHAKGFAVGDKVADLMHSGTPIGMGVVKSIDSGQKRVEVHWHRHPSLSGQVLKHGKSELYKMITASDVSTGGSND